MLLVHSRGRTEAMENAALDGGKPWAAAGSALLSCPIGSKQLMLFLHFLTPLYLLSLQRLLLCHLCNPGQATSLCLSLLICKMWIITFPPSEDRGMKLSSVRNVKHSASIVGANIHCLLISKFRSHGSPTCSLISTWPRCLPFADLRQELSLLPLFLASVGRGLSLDSLFWTHWTHWKIHEPWSQEPSNFPL